PAGPPWRGRASRSSPSSSSTGARGSSRSSGSWPTGSRRRWPSGCRGSPPCRAATRGICTSAASSRSTASREDARHSRPRSPGPELGGSRGGCGAAGSGGSERAERGAGLALVAVAGPQPPGGPVFLIALVDLRLALTVGLTGHAEPGERQGLEPSLGDLRFAILAQPVGAVVDAPQGLVDGRQLVAVAIDQRVADLAIAGVAREI